MTHNASEFARPRLLSQPVAGDETARQLAALGARDPNEWTALFEQHRDLVFRAALAQLGEREAAEDVTGQVFLEAIEGIRRYRDRGRPLSAWLLTIARHRCLDAVRKRKRDETLAARQTADVQPPVVPHSLLALEALTREQREIIHLRFVEDLSIEEAARVSGRTPGAVKALQHRALRQLRAQLESNTTQGKGHA